MFFFKQKTAYEMRISDWSSDVCSSDLAADCGAIAGLVLELGAVARGRCIFTRGCFDHVRCDRQDQVSNPLFRNGLSIKINGAVFYLDEIAGQAADALDIILQLMRRGLETPHHSALRLQRHSPSRDQRQPERQDKTGKA